MKKILVAVNVFLLACTFSFAAEKSNLDAKLEAAIAAAAKPVGIKKEPRQYDLSLTAQEGVWGKEDHVFTAEPADTRQYTTMSNTCKVYALSDRWAIASARCIQDVFYSNQFRSGDEAHVRVYRLEDSSKKEAKPADRFLALVGKNGIMKTRHQRIASNGNIMLVWHPNGEYAGPFTNVLAMEEYQKLTSLMKSFFFVGGRILVTKKFPHSRSLTVKSIPQENNFRLCRTSFPTNNGFYGQAASGLLGFDKNGDGFLTGLNAGVVQWSPMAAKIYSQYDTSSSNVWNGLTKDDLMFIKQTVQAIYPEDWEQVKKHLFYKVTDSPFFR